MRPHRPSRSTAARPGRRLLVCGLLSFLFLCSRAPAGNWPAWRGPAGTGVGDETSLPLHWDAKQNVRWHVPLPDRGNSTPVVWGERVFVTQAVEKERRRTVMCFDRADGKLLWQSGVTVAGGREPTNAQNPYCSASPVTDGRHVYAYFGSPGLWCFDLQGREVWHRELGKVDSWQGSGSSPVLHGNLCFLNAGPGTDAALVACEKESGEVVWKVTPPLTPPKPATRESAEERSAGAAPPATAPAPPSGAGGFDGAMMSADPGGAGGFLGSWSTPVVLHQGDHDELVVVHALAVTAYDPASGKPVWTCGGLPEQAFASPAVGEGILVAAGHRVAGGGTRFTAVRLGGSGDVTASHRLWQTDLPKDCVGSGAIAAGRFYAVTQFGTAVCLDLASGKKQWEKRLTGRGNLAGSWSSIVLADGKLWVPNHGGEVFVLKAGPEFEIVADNLAAEEATCSSLAVSDGQVFLRTHKGLWCFGMEERDSPQRRRGR